MDAEFRGPDIPPPALRVAAEFARPGEPLHAALVGRAAASVVREPQRWADRGTGSGEAPAPLARAGPVRRSGLIVPVCRRHGPAARNRG
nr:DUF3626 domain-containing protein [Micromonospora provocatoris]